MLRPATLPRAMALACAWTVMAVGAAEPLVPDAAHVVQTARGDTVIGLGRRYLADPARWPELVRANALRNPNRIAAGATLRIPLRLMRTESVPATVLSVVGEARSGAAGPLKAGQSVDEGGEVSTGADGHVTIRLVDGTLLRLRPTSRLKVDESRKLPDAGAVQSGARLEQGRVEVDAAPAPAGRPGFRIGTPHGVLGVRGTEFRVLTDAALGITRGEVLGGTVVFEGRVGSASERVAAGFGSLIDGNQVSTPVRLLNAPDVSALPALQERLLMRFALTPMDGAAAYRGQIARDAAFDQVVADLTSRTPELRFAELVDGDYVLRVRAIDARGLEGRDADFRFRLKARPEAPLPSAPPSRAVMSGNQVDFAWAANDEARSYRLRLASDPQFKTGVRELKDLRTLSVAFDGLAPGTYHWQVSAVRADGDTGPWGAVRSFELRPEPPAPKPAKVGDNLVAFDWEGAPGQTFEFQVARDASFQQRVIERQLDRPGVELALPGTGRFYMRLRARDADGFIGPYTTPQYVDVPNCVRDSTGGCVRAGSETLNLGS